MAVPVAAPPAAPLDADAERALAWLARGKPQADILYDDAVPPQTAADRDAFAKASYRRVKP